MSEHVNGLIRQAHTLAAQAGECHDGGDDASADALLEQAEMLACDITQTLDELEHRQSALLDMLNTASSSARAEGGTSAAVGGRLAQAGAFRRIALGLGAGLALGGLVTEC